MKGCVRFCLMRGHATGMWKPLVNCLRVISGKHTEKTVKEFNKKVPAPTVPGSVNEALHDLAMNPKQS